MIEYGLMVIGLVAIGLYATFSWMFYALFRARHPQQGRGLALLAGLRWPAMVARAGQLFRDR